MRPWVDWVLVTSVLGLMAYRQALIATSNQRVLSALAETVRERTASLQWLSDHHEGILASATRPGHRVRDGAGLPRHHRALGDDADEERVRLGCQP